MLVRRDKLTAYRCQLLTLNLLKVSRANMMPEAKGASASKAQSSIFAAGARCSDLSAFVRSSRPEPASETAWECHLSYRNRAGVL